MFLQAFWLWTLSDYGQAFATVLMGALPAALKASTPKIEAIPAMNGLPGASATLYEVLFAGMLASKAPLT